ncbi:excisionase [[Clostridium] aminophilum]|uniref:excisionase n=1 Tax=[Clostridium] aminophilum TaxID=1526 RepID=UPI003F9585E6
MTLIADQNAQKEPERVPVYEKVTLTIREAAEYSNIGINRLETMLRSPRCQFVLYVGKKKLVKRRKFEKYITDRIEIWNHCKCGLL